MRTLYVQKTMIYSHLHGYCNGALNQVPSKPKPFRIMSDALNMESISWDEFKKDVIKYNTCQVITERTIENHQQSIAMEGPPKALLGNPHIKEAYLGI